jgi:acetyl-CoA carboxylase alpha subunit
MRHFLDFEKPVAELETKIAELQALDSSAAINIAEEVDKLADKADKQLRGLYAKLTPWQKTQVARHPDRPKVLRYLAALITDYTPLAGDRVLMLEHAIYSVISPEGCASILWRDQSQAPTAAEALRLTAEDLRQLKLIDQIIPEPIGGAHRSPSEVIEAVAQAIEAALQPLLALDSATLKARRRQKFLDMGREPAD